MQSVFGRVHCGTPAAAGNLAISLSEQGKYAEAARIERELLVLRTRLLGADHESTLRMASNPTVSLAQCGQKAEAEQILRGTLAVARRVLGPTHVLIRRVFWYRRARSRSRSVIR